MNWSLSEFLNQIELRGQNWCFIEMGAYTGFRLPHSEAIFFHAILEGATRITTAAEQVFDCNAGDIVIVLPGETHKVRNHQGRTAPLIPMLTDGDPADAPSVVKLGKGHVANRLLSGRLEVLWPGGFRPSRMPTMFLIQSAELGFDLARFTETATGPGASALLTRLATLLFVNSFRNDPLCRAQLQLNLHDPIARAKVIIEIYPFKPWKVASLAARVGMGRSNFATRFAAQIGKTPIDVLTEERMKHAGNFLRSTNLKIAEVSERVGYRSEATFIRRFTLHFGMTPGKWRREGPAIP